MADFLSFDEVEDDLSPAPEPNFIPFDEVEDDVEDTRSFSDKLSQSGKDLSAAYLRGMAGISDSVATAAEYVPFGQSLFGLDDWAKEQRDLGQQARSTIEEQQGEDYLPQWAQSGVEGLVSTLPGALFPGGAVAKGVGTAVDSATQKIARLNNESEEQQEVGEPGFSQAGILGSAAVQLPVDAALNAIPFASGVGTNSIKSLAANVGKGALAGAGTGAVGGVSDVLTDSIATGDLPSIDKTLEAAQQSAATGGVTGAGYAGISGVGDWRSNNQAIANEANMLGQVNEQLGFDNANQPLLDGQEANTSIGLNPENIYGDDFTARPVTEAEVKYQANKEQLNNELPTDINQQAPGKELSINSKAKVQKDPLADTTQEFPDAPAKRLADDKPVNKSLSLDDGETIFRALDKDPNVLPKWGEELPDPFISYKKPNEQPDTTISTSEKALNDINEFKAEYSGEVSPSRRDQAGSAPIISDLAKAGYDMYKWARDRFSDGLVDTSRFSDSDSFFRGQIYKGGVDHPAIAKARKLLTFDKTLADKFPAYKRVHDTIKDYVADKFYIGAKFNQLTKPLYDLDSKSAAKVGNLLFAERVARRKAADSGQVSRGDFTDSQLTGMGLNEKEVLAYRSVRAAMSASLDLMGESLKQKAKQPGVDPVKAGEYIASVDQWINRMRDTAYVPFSRFDDKFQVISFDPTGKVGYISYHPTRGAAAKEALRLKKENGGDYKVEPMKVQPSNAYRQIPADLGVSLGKFDPEVFNDRASATNVKGFEGHLVEADLVPGYSRDIKRVLADYFIGLGHFAANKKHSPRMDDAIAQINIDPSQGPTEGALFNHANDYVRMVKEGTGNGVNSWLRLMNLYHLAGVPSSAFTNLTQSFITTPAEIVRYTKNPFLGAKILTESLAEAATVLAPGTKKIASKVSPERYAAIQQGILDGSLDAQLFSELQGYARGSKLEQSPTKAVGNALANLNDGMMFLFSEAEKFNRITAFIAGHKVAERRGLVGREAIDFANKFTEETQFIQNESNRNMLSRSGVGKVATQYRLFQGHMLRYLRNRATKDGWPAVATSIAMIGALGGLSSLPFFRDIKNVSDSAGADIDKYGRKFLADDEFADMLMYGVPTKAGINLSGAMSGNFLPEIDKDPIRTVGAIVAGPTGNFLTSMWKAGKAYDEGNTIGALTSASPRFARGPIKAADAIRTGEIRDLRSRTIVSDPTAAEIGMVGLGFQPDRISDFYRKSGSAYMVDQAARDNDNINKRIAMALRDNNPDKVQELISEAIEKKIKPDSDAIKQAYIGLIRPDLASIMAAPKKARPEIADIWFDDEEAEED